MSKLPWRLGAGVVAWSLVLLGSAAPAHAQYFGQNKVQYDHLKFQILKTPHFDIYFYPEEQDAAKEVSRMAERWYTRLSHVLDHDLTSRQPVVLYASHPDFASTNVIEGELGEGTGGVTEGAMRRVVLPIAASLAETDHVLGHELTHAFQYDILGQNAEGLPLWFIEGMAEYLSLGAHDVQTSMWLRDAALQEKLPAIKDLDNPRYFPYRFGHAFWAYVGGKWGDAVTGEILRSLAYTGPGGGQGRSSNADAVAAIENATGTDRDTLSTEWKSAIVATVLPANRQPNTSTIEPQAIGNARGQDVLNVGPALSPDGTRIAFLSARDRLSIDLFVGDAATGKNVKKLIDTSADPHFDSLEFLQSAGAWDPAGKRLVIATLHSGRPELTIVDADKGSVIKEVPFKDLDEIYQPTWAPDGNAVAFAAQTGGHTDLFVYDLKGGSTKRLTDDTYADLQPSWSPDGKQIAFVTDRFTTDLSKLAYKGYRIASIMLDSSQISPIDTGISGNTTNPQWSADGNSLYFLSDHGGRPNAYRIDLKPGERQAVQLTDAATGIAGITPLSPALSVATAGGRAAVSVFSDGGYSIHFIEAAQTSGLPSIVTGPAADTGTLPGAAKTPGIVDAGLAQPDAGLPAAPDYQVEPYKPGLHLVGIGQQVGVAAGSTFGTYVMGGIALEFSDMLGNHLLGTSFSINGGARDVAASITYLNRVHRWNWGTFGERVPILTGSVQTAQGTINGQSVFVQQTDIFRETFTQTGMLTSYPLSRATRIEFSGAVRHIGFHEEITTDIADAFSGQLLSEVTQTVPSVDSLMLYDASTALVKDTTSFGATSPIAGQRLRLEFAPTFGDLRLNSVTLDVRRYVMPVRPITFAGRLVHLGRYGSGSEDPRMQPLFLGYSTLVRGYDINSFTGDECHPNATSSCPEFDRLIGSRMLIFNGEVRAPLVGLFRHRLDYGALPIEVFGFFDSGATWTKEISLGSNGHNFVSSAGAGARVNVLGFVIAEFNLVKALDRPQRGLQFVFNLRPGF